MEALAAPKLFLLISPNGCTLALSDVISSSFYLLEPSILLPVAIKNLT
jgi:hypothetical protein